jgi:hypothetical protein
MKRVFIITIVIATLGIYASVYAAPAPKVADVNAVVLEPIQATVGKPVNQGLATVYTVPSGKRLIIEFVSATVLVGSVSDMGTMLLRTALLDENGLPDIKVHRFVLTPQDTWAGGFRLEASQPTRLYADPGTDVEVEFSCSTCSGIGAQSEVTISGFLMDVP